MLLGGIQVVPFVEDAGQTKMRFVDNLKWLMTCQLQDVLVGLGCLIQLVVCFLDVAQGDGRQDSSEDIPGCLAERDGFSNGPASCDTISQRRVAKPQCPVSGSA